MKVYYLHENNATIGPFSKEELAVKKITRFTPIWCEGFDNWKTAGEITALQAIVTELPSPTEVNNEIPKEDTVFGFNKKGVLVVLGSLLVLLITLVLMNYQSSKIIDIEKTNKEIQKENYVKEIEKQKQKIEAQNKVLTEKERLEKERFNSGRRQADENTYKEILSAISNSYKGLEDAKEELEKAKGYRLFRSAKKKEEEINEAAYEIEIWKRKIELLKLEKREVEIRLNQ